MGQSIIIKLTEQRITVKKKCECNKGLVGEKGWGEGEIEKEWR
jgi:hypothetical protein